MASAVLAPSADTLSLACPIGFASWRSALALMLPPEDRSKARALAAAELADAHRSGVSRRIGIALRALGLLDDDREAGRAKLGQAVAVLADSPARLEHARALVELGASLRRDSRRAASRASLRDGLDLAARCGATRLADRARTELAATGARPRRERVTGRDALTPSELRVAHMASRGLRQRRDRPDSVRDQEHHRYAPRAPLRQTRHQEPQAAFRRPRRPFSTERSSMTAVTRSIGLAVEPSIALFGAPSFEGG